MKVAPAVLTVIALAGVGVVSAGCAETATVNANPVWSATVPEHGVECSKTSNFFPFYSKNVTVYADRIEESGNVLLFISWTNVTRRSNVGEPVAEEPCASRGSTPEGADGFGGEKMRTSEAGRVHEEASPPEQAEPAGSAEGETAEAAEAPGESKVPAPSDAKTGEPGSGAEENQ